MIILIISIIVILIAAISSYIYIKKQRDNGMLIQKQRWINQIPSMLSTLGVLGTFIGITIALVNFDAGTIEVSITTLLDGLKTAFFTSLAGMISSLILSKYVSNIYDEEDGGVSDINQAAGEIVKSVAKMTDVSERNTNAMLLAISSLSDSIKNQANQQLSYFNIANTNMKSVLEMINASNTSSENIAKNTEQIPIISGNIQEISASTESLKLYAASQDSHLGQIKPAIDSLGHNTAEMLDITSTSAGVREEILANVSKFGDRLHNEVVEIEEKMADTNKLLEQKFNEFTELLKKSNTEALVEVMKKVTEEFQKQMNDLVSKLVKENFDQLNKSVEMLNQWQKENKEMIKSLTKQYKEMATDFEGTSNTLNKVGKDTDALVASGSKLQQIVDALNEVMVKDEKFIEITKNLSSTTAMTKDTMVKFDESTSKLNEWVRKQRNFVDGVNLLIVKLEEINKIKSYADEFWKETREGMNESVTIIKDGSKQLNKQLTHLDAQFYERLNKTLANLDACIQAIVENYD